MNPNLSNADFIAVSEQESASTLYRGAAYCVQRADNEGDPADVRSYYHCQAIELQLCAARLSASERVTRLGVA